MKMNLALGAKILWRDVTGKDAWWKKKSAKKIHVWQQKEMLGQLVHEQKWIVGLGNVQISYQDNNSEIGVVSWQRQGN